MREIKTENEYNELLSNDKLVVLDIFAEWCGPCKSMMPVLEELSDEHESSVEIVKMDADNDEISTILQSFRVRSIPTLIVIKNGEVQTTLIGARTKNELSETISQFV